MLLQLFQDAGFAQHRLERGIEDRRHGEGEHRVDERCGKLGEHRRPHGGVRIAVNKALIDKGFEHIERDIAERADRTAGNDAAVRVTPKGDLRADPCHGKL